MKHAPKLASPFERRQVERTHPALILLTAEEGAVAGGSRDATMAALTTLLAQTLAHDYGDAVLVVHLDEPSAEDPWATQSGPPTLSPSMHFGPGRAHTQGISTDAEHADHLTLPVPFDPRGAAEVLVDRLRPLFHRYAYVFVDASARGPGFSRWLETEIGLTDLHGVVRRLVSLSPEIDTIPPAPEAHAPASKMSVAMSVSFSRRRPQTFTMPPPAPWSVLKTRILPPRRPHVAYAPLSPEGMKGRLEAAKRLAARLVDRLGGSAIEASGQAYPPARVIPERCRVRIDLDAVRAPDARYSELPEPTQRAFSRWGRALTWRRVGVALGGSGAWGYAHVALLSTLEENGIPIDIIGGSSSGALMGAYYSVLGRSGLDLAVERGRRFERLALASTITSTVIDLGVESDLGDAMLEELEIILLPVATNLSHARAEVITKSPVASAVRASASAPGFFASTITRSGLYVDGAVTDNVPVVLVERLGADLLIACNPLPPPPSVRVHMPTTPLRDFLAELNPVNRLRDLLVSFELMFHDFGDCEEAEHRVVYEPPPETGPLFQTFEYSRARELVEEVKREDAFRTTTRRSIAAWGKLSAARGSSGRGGVA